MGLSGNRRADWDSTNDAHNLMILFFVCSETLLLLGPAVGLQLRKRRPSWDFAVTEHNHQRARY